MRKWQHKLHEVIYEADTFYGKLFDIILPSAGFIDCIVIERAAKSTSLEAGESPIDVILLLNSNVTDAAVEAKPESTKTILFVATSKGAVSNID